MSISKRESVLFNIRLSCGLVLLNVVFLNLLLNSTSLGRIDLTDGNIHSLSEVTENIVSNLAEEVHITGYFSQVENMHEEIRPFVPAVRDLLQSYGDASEGMVDVEFIVPEDDEEAEQKALSEFGIVPSSFAFRDRSESGVRSFYFAVVIEYPASTPVTIGLGDLVQRNLFDEGASIELKNVEFEITRALKKAISGFESKRQLFSLFKHNSVIRTFLSPSNKLPELFKDVPDNVRKVVAKIADSSQGKVKWDDVEVPGDDAGRKALMTRYQAQAIAFPGQEEPFYLSAIIELDGAPVAELPLWRLTDQALAEFDIRQMIEGFYRRRTKGLLRTIGVAQMQPEQDPRAMQMGQRQEPAPFMALEEELRRTFDVESIDLGSARSIPDSVDLLLVMEPRTLSEAALYAIDQYVMRGGPTIVCADRNDFPMPRSLGDFNATAIETGMEDLLKSWGVELSDEVVFDDLSGEFFFEAGPQQAGGRGRRGASRVVDIDWPGAPLVGRDEKGANRDSPALAGFEEIRFWLPSAVRVTETDGIESTELFRSSDRAWLRNLPTTLTPDFRLDKKRGFVVPGDDKLATHLFGVLLQGRFESYFAARPIPGVEPSEADSTEAPETTATVTAPLKQSRPETRVIVISDGDWLHNREAGFTAQIGPPYGYFDRNILAMRGLVDWLLLDDDLIRIRSRGRSFRPLEKLEEESINTITFMNFSIPLASVLLLGIVVFLRRSRRKSLV